MNRPKALTVPAVFAVLSVLGSLAGGLVAARTRAPPLMARRVRRSR
jgi:hypothetical protein